jgi:hypothetical protein
VNSEHKYTLALIGKHCWRQGFVKYSTEYLPPLNPRPEATNNSESIATLYYVRLRQMAGLDHRTGGPPDPAAVAFHPSIHLGRSSSTNRQRHLHGCLCESRSCREGLLEAVEYLVVVVRCLQPLSRLKIVNLVPICYRPRLATSLLIQASQHPPHLTV